MSTFKDKYRIETTRLREWDYSSPWWYYVTICTKDHKEYFGHITRGDMKLNEAGKICSDFWKEIPIHYPMTELDYYVVMPNHIHGIILIKYNSRSRDVARNVSTLERNKFSNISPKPNSISVIIRSFKSAVTKHMRELGAKDFQWQTRFYDRIIRSEKELNKIRKYIEQNPLKWEIEKNRSESISNDFY